MKNHSRLRLGRKWSAARRTGLRFSQGSKLAAAEVLEDRTLLTAYLVDTLDDVVASDGKLSLREAVQAASSNSAVNEAVAGQGGAVIDTIAFDASLTGGTITLSGTRLNITGSLSITGLGSDQLTISGDGRAQIFHVDALASLTLRDLSLKSGNANGDTVETRSGGAVHNLGQLALEDVALTNNASQFQGGAIYSTGTVGMTGGEISDNVSSFGAGIFSSGNATFTDVSFFRNDASHGGAIHNSHTGVVTIRDSLFVGNESAFGSAINNSGFNAIASITGSTIRNNIGTHNGAIKSIGTLSINTTTIANNTGVWGGGIDTSGTATVSNSTISGNSVGAGGGGINNSGTLTVVNSTISGNSAEWSGGGIEFSGGTATLRNVTVTGNRADSDSFGTDNGGGLSVKDGFATARLYNTIVVGNFLGAGSVLNDVAGPFIADSRNNVIGVTGTAGNLEDGTNDNVVGVNAATVLDPFLKDNGGPTLTHALIAGSAALNGGSNAHAVDWLGNPLSTDQRGVGFSRIVGSSVDVGAVEGDGSLIFSSIVVDTLADEDDGNYEAGDLSLREAVGLVEEGGSITFASALAGGTITLTLGQLDLTRDMSIIGLGATELTISGNDASRIFEVEVGADVTLISIRLADGNARYDTESRGGGAIKNAGTLTLTDVRFEDNTDNYGGSAIYNLGFATMTGGAILRSHIADGILNSNVGVFQISGATFTENDVRVILNAGTLSVADSVFEGNRSDTGAAIYNTGANAIANVSRTTFIDNETTFVGGAIGALEGRFKIADSLFKNNKASAGGAIANWTGVVEISGSTFLENQSVGEGGAILSEGVLTIANSTISGNTANADGGGIYAPLSAMTLRNVTIFGNQSDADGDSNGTGGGIYVGDWLAAELHNTIIAGNFAGIGNANDVGGTLSATSSHNLIGDAATAGGLADGSNGNIVGVDWTTVIDPVLKNNGGPTLTHELLLGGAAINNGSNAQALDANGDPLVTDQRGFGRINGITVDIGAVESQSGAPTTVIVDILSDEDDGNYEAGDLSLREAIQLVADGGTVAFASALSGGTITLSLGRITLDRDVTISGLGADQLSISGQSLFQIFFVTAAAEVTISDVTLKGGNANGSTADTRSGGAIYNLGSVTLSEVDVVGNRSNFFGGAIYNDGFLAIDGGRVAQNIGTFGGAILNDQDATLSLSGVTVENNTGNHSAAIENRGFLTAANSTFTNNAATFGGALSNSLLGTATIVGGSFTGNTATYGGAIDNAGTLFVSEVTFSGNRATSIGGAVHGSGTMTFVASTFSANTSDWMAGAIQSHGTLRLINSTLSGNSARGDAGGLRVSNGTATLRNVTITGNRADSDGNSAGVAGGINVGLGTVTLYNTLVAGNYRGLGSFPDDVIGTLSAASSHNLVGNAASAGGLQNGSNGNIVGVNWPSVLDPVLRNNGGPTKTHALTTGSLAANAGSNAQAIGPDGLPLNSDQRGSGFSRFVRGVVDIGAFELPNADPISSAIQFSTGENVILTGNLLTHIQDSEGDDLEVTEIEGDAAAVGQPIFLPSGAQVLVNADGSFTYDPAGAFASLEVGQTALESFSYTVSDAFGGTTTAVVEIVIHGAVKVIVGDGNPTTTEAGNSQNPAKVAIGPAGHIVTAWVHQTPEGDTDIRFRRYTETGASLDASDRVVSVQSSDDEDSPSVAVAANGSFVIGYRIVDDGGDFDVVFDIYDASGAFVRQVQLFEIEESDQFALDLAISANGDIIAVWQEPRTGNHDVYVQIFDQLGDSRIGPFAIPEESPGSPETNPTVAVDRFGNFVVAYNAGTSGIAVRRFSTNGGPLGARLLLSPPSLQVGDQLSEPYLGRADDGSFIIAYGVTPATGSQYGYWHLFNADGTLRTQAATTAGNFVTSVDMDKIGNFVLGVTRTTLGGDTQAEAIFFDAAGEQGETVNVNQTATGLQSQTQVAIHNNILASSYIDDAASDDVEFSVIEQRRSQFGVARPNGTGGLRFFLDSNGNGVFDGGDAVFNFGLAGDIVVVGDWNGDGIDDYGVARANGSGGLTFFLDSNGDREFDSGDLVFNFGLVGDIIIVGDWNGDGIADLGVGRRNLGGGLVFSLDSNGSRLFDGTDSVFNFGLFGDIIVVGDWDGDGIDQLGVARRNGSGGLVFSLDSNDSRFFEAGQDAVFNYGLEGDDIITGDWDGDGKDTLGVVRPNGSGGQRIYPDVNENYKFDVTDSLFAFDFGLADDLLLAGAWR